MGHRARGINKLPGTRSSRIRNALSALETLDGIASGAVPLVDSLKADGASIRQLQRAAERLSSVLENTRRARNDVGALILAHEQE
jgi:hypothetical protein